MKKKTRPVKIKARTPLKAIRTAVADYMRSEGCGCCGDYEGHKEHAAILGKLLNVPKYKDGSGYDFTKFRTALSLVRPTK